MARPDSAPRPTHRYGFRWPQPLYDAAVERARYEERTLAQFVRWIIRQTLEADAGATQKPDQQAHDRDAPQRDVNARLREKKTA
jgi:hypothetical protein